MTLKRGDGVWATIEGECYFGGVILVSENQHSLALHFCNGQVSMAGGAHGGIVALLWDEKAEVYRDLVTEVEVKLEPVEETTSGD
jgi:hypothetical protein